MSDIKTLKIVLKVSTKVRDDIKKRLDKAQIAFDGMDSSAPLYSICKTQTESLEKSHSDAAARAHSANQKLIVAEQVALELAA